MLNKPHWMPRDQWADYVLTRNIEKCKFPGCEETEDLSVDHIIPRYQGGTDDSSNLQTYCMYHNRQKGPRPDRYWENPFYFDPRPDLNIDAFRTAQKREAYGRILDEAEWFTKPFSQIGRVLYIAGVIVGGGKTLIIPALAFGLNYAIQRDRGLASPRVDRILVLAKEQAIRDQLALDLQQDIVKYGICQSAPRVGIIADGSVLDSEASGNFQTVLNTKDIWVSCIQMLYEKNNQPRKNLERILASFPLIVVDEPHYALTQVLKIVEASTLSLCFGLTGTPIYANGAAIRHFALLSVYGYDDAVANDRSLKFASDDRSAWNSLVDVINIEHAETLQNGDEVEVEDPHTDGYGKNLIPAVSVIERVIQYVVDCDASDDTTPAKHRPVNTISDFRYPVHALIVADTIEIGKELTRLMNEKFDQNRRLYPENKGYYAEVVHSDQENLKGKIKGKPLNTDHPWMRYKQKGKIDRRCARFLVVIGIGREGVNNPACGVVGVTCARDSVVEAVQRWIGRELRSISDGEHVPPERLDTIKIITHAAFRNEATIAQGLDFIMNMSDHLSVLPTIEDLKSDNMEDLELPEKTDLSIPTNEVIDYIAMIGNERLLGNELDASEILERIRQEYPYRMDENNPGRINRISDLISEIIENPQDTWRKMRHHREIAPIGIVLQEYLIVEPDDKTLKDYIKTHQKSLVHHLSEFDKVRDWAYALYQQHAQSFHMGALRPSTDTFQIHRMYVSEIHRHLGRHFTGGDDTSRKSALGKLTNTAMKIKLGVKRGEKLSKGGKYDIPQAHAILTRPDVKQELLGYIRGQLIRQGFCPSLSAVFESVMKTNPVEFSFDDEEDLPWQ